MPEKQLKLSVEEMRAYRVKGFTCTNCAAIFESNVKALPGVVDASVNFGASKLYVQGNVTIEELERAGAFEILRIRDEREEKLEREPFWKQKENIKLYISSIILLISFFLGERLGAEHILPTIACATSIIIGGYSLFIKGLKNLSRLQFDMNTLMTIAIIGAAIIGEWREGATVVILSLSAKH